MRGAIVRLDEAWQQVQSRRASNSETGAYPPPVRALLGQMLAAGVLMQSGLKFNGALILQVQGDGPVKLAVAEVQSDLSLRATASVTGELPADARLPDMVNVGGGGRCAITLDPKDRLPGQQPYQGVVPLQDVDGKKFARLSDALQFYMLQSEQLDTTIVLAANDEVAAGLMIQRMPIKGQDNLAGATESALDDQDRIGANEEYNRIATLAASLKREELLSLDVDTILRRLFWEEKLLRFVPQDGDHGPRFACTCSRGRVEAMLRNLGQAEVDDIVAERGCVEVGCDYCGTQYRFDIVDAGQLFADAPSQAPGSSSMQ